MVREFHTLNVNLGMVHEFYALDGYTVVIDYYHSLTSMFPATFWGLDMYHLILPSLSFSIEVLAKKERNFSSNLYLASNDM